MSAIQYLKNDDGIIILTLDSPNQSANTMNGDFRVALENLKHRLLGLFSVQRKKPFLQAVTWMS